MLTAQMPVSKRLCKAVNLTLRFRRKLSRIEDPLGETALAMGERFERAASVARTLCIAASRVEGRLGGTTKPTLESVTIEQARSLRSVDKTLKGIHKELRRRVSHTVADARRMRLTSV